LSDDAMAILQSQKSRSGPVFPITVNALKLAWERAVARSGLSNLHFHDLRHEAVSRFFEMGLSLPEVAVISGHRDPRMLFRYTHLRPTDLARKLIGRRWTASGEAQLT
jgi:integrase